MATKSRIPTDETLLSVTRPTPLDFIAFIPYACFQMEAPFQVTIVSRVMKEYVSASEKSKKSRRDKSITQYTSSAHMSHDKERSESTVAVRADGGGPLVHLTALYDSAGRLVELLFRRTTVPELLLQVIGVCLPYQPYLNKITIRWGVIDGYSIYEIAKHLRQSHITELCLDDSPVAHRNQYLLLEYATQLKCLSLERCRLDDKDCIEIAAKLVYPLPAGRTLSVLSLASNIITNDGATALGAMLRSNRQLRFLNLSGNQISDAGAASIFSSLMDFPMTYDEIISKRSRSIEYLKLQKQVYTKCYNELLNAPVVKSLDDRGSGRKRNVSRAKRQSATALTATSEPLTLDHIAAKAKNMARELIGPNNDPFCVRDTIRKDAHIYSIGNLSLAYLNLSYNNLGHVSLEKLVEVVRYQEKLTLKSQPGLMKVVVEGNPMPCRTRELHALQSFNDSIGLNQLPTPSRNEKFKTVKLSQR